MKNKTDKVKRGEIYYYNFGVNEGSIQNGLRPVLIVQCDDGNKVSTTTIVAPITTAIKKRYLPSHIFLGEEGGLKMPSMVLLEQLDTINQSDLLDRVGCVTDEKLERLINNGLKKALGLWQYKKPEQEDIRSLCSKCLADYKLNKGIVLKRLNPYGKTKERCDKCNGVGYDYLIIKKHPAK
ncbi:MAG: type II toxin-antitoxin system PemK/MazF family toxin [Paludibacter sp.]|nr:type II toxin-antitoxin system PemK/MazF family toxin [Paludibacter sp.]